MVTESETQEKEVALACNKLGANANGINFIDRFAKTLRKQWNALALNNFGEEPITYKELATRIEHHHLLWRRMGLKAGDKIAINAASSAQWVEIFMAIVSGGYVAVPLLNGYQPGDTQRLIDHSDSRILYVETALFERMSFEEMPQLLAAIDLRSGTLLASRNGFDEEYTNLGKTFNEAHSNGFTEADIQYPNRHRDDVCVINYTSGSTGNPKGVMLTVGNFSTNVDEIISVLPFCEGDRYLSILPLAHIFGLTVDAIVTLCSGMHVTVLCSLPVPQTLKTALLEVRPRLFFAVPLVLSKMLDFTIGEFINSKTGKDKLFEWQNHPDFCKALRTIFMSAFGDRCEGIVTGGAAIPKEIEELLYEKMQVPFLTGYGMTECAPVISLGRLDDYRMRSCGQIQASYAYRIDSTDPEHMAGELCVKGPCVFSGYYKNEDATQSSFTPDGFFRTGDLGTVTKDGHLFLVGRCKSMLLSTNGQNIYPEEIEVILNTMPYVAESLIVHRQNRLVALIVPQAEKMVNDQLDSETLDKVLRRNIEELNKRIPSYSTVVEYELMESPFAKTPKGSIKRFMYS